MTEPASAETSGAHTTVLLGAGASHDAGVPLAKALTKLAMEAAVADARTRRPEEPRLSMALAFVVNAMQRHAIARGATKADQLGDLPGIEQVVNAVAMLAARADLEISPFVAAWDPAISSVDPDGRSIEVHAVKGLAGAMAGQLNTAFGGGSHEGDLARGLAKAMDSYNSPRQRLSLDRASFAETPG